MHILQFKSSMLPAYALKLVGRGVGTPQPSTVTLIGSAEAAVINESSTKPALGTVANMMAFP